MLTEIENRYTILNKNEPFVKTECPICGNEMKILLPNGYDVSFDLKYAKNTKYKSYCKNCRRLIKYTILRKKK